ncbi:hypothetical protein SORBI_3001G299300 [Sorghum bicolor]|uniref:Uncharacterized protein n=1 Tax=Sorghum bicolor TaxID=4558 RepID=A0A1B6QLZ0_SORBI|nr:hypothetical protein SORBI_3001G299300 [Sorghum bicolor]
MRGTGFFLAANSAHVPQIAVAACMYKSMEKTEKKRTGKNTEIKMLFPIPTCMYKTKRLPDTCENNQACQMSSQA